MSIFSPQNFARRNKHSKIMYNNIQDDSSRWSIFKECEEKEKVPGKTVYVPQAYNMLMNQTLKHRLYQQMLEEDNFLHFSFHRVQKFKQKVSELISLEFTLPIIFSN